MSDAAPRQPWYVQPRIMLPIVAVVVLVVVLFTPEPSAGGNDQRLTSYSTRAPGVRMLYELAERLGWEVERARTVPLPLDSSSTIAVLAPPIPLRAREVHALLEHVRGGGSLLVVATRGAGSIADSLGLVSEGGGDSLTGPNSSRSCSSEAGTVGALLSGDVARFAYYTSLKFKEPPVGVVDTLLSVRGTRDKRGSIQPVVLGMALGEGRVVITSATFLLRNDMLRRCSTGLDIIAVRSLEYLAATAGDSRQLVFDEYHQGYGQHAGSLPAILAEFAATRAGRVFYQLAGAGLLLLFAFAPRALPPREPPPPDRRSPLEHVDALARAYQQVGARKTATQRLVRGLRRRVHRNAAPSRAQADEQFLVQVEQRHPALRTDVALLRTALQQGASREQWTALPDALDRIEHTLTRT